LSRTNTNTGVHLGFRQGFSLSLKPLV